VFLQTLGPVWDADFSPDGQWLAHGSRESGGDEVYVCPFPAARGKSWKISSQGGYSARWSPDGSELFYLNPEFDLMVSAITFQPTFQAAPPRVLFKAARRPGAGTGEAGYAVMPDGQHFVMLQPAGTPRQIQVTLSWVQDLKHRGLLR
jgi:Tol biopolymer transport system component